MKELTKICSNCGESIPGDAFKCPYCGSVNPKGEKGKELKVVHDSLLLSFGRWLHAISPHFLPIFAGFTVMFVGSFFVFPFLLLYPMTYVAFIFLILIPFVALLVGYFIL